MQRTHMSKGLQHEAHVRPGGYAAVFHNYYYDNYDYDPNQGFDRAFYHCRSYIPFATSAQLLYLHFAILSFCRAPSDFEPVVPCTTRTMCTCIRTTSKIRFYNWHSFMQKKIPPKSYKCRHRSGLHLQNPV